MPLSQTCQKSRGFRTRATLGVKSKEWETLDRGFQTYKISTFRGRTGVSKLDFKMHSCIKQRLKFRPISATSMINPDLGHELSLRSLLSSSILKLGQFSAKVNKSSLDSSGWSSGFMHPLGGTSMGTRSRRDLVPSPRHSLIMLLNRVARRPHLLRQIL